MKIRIDLNAYRANLVTLKDRLAPSELMAVVKDDAYGHGIDQIVAAARQAGIVAFAVLDLETGIRLRRDGHLDRERAFAWLCDEGDEFAEGIRCDIELGVSHIAVLDAIAAAVTDKPARVHLKIDSGLHRNGASLDQWPALLLRARHWSDQGRCVVVGIWTHIGEASEADDAASRVIFDEAIAQARGAGFNDIVCHLAASAASFDRPEFRYDMARVGGFTYGIGPGDGVGPADLGLSAVMSAHARVLGTHSFGSREVAVLDGGYVHGLPAWHSLAEPSENDGLPRSGFDVLLNGQRCPIVQVNAYETLVATTMPANAGDTAVLFGSHLRGEPVLQEWADAIGTVGEEIVVRMGTVNDREYVGD